MRFRRSVLFLLLLAVSACVPALAIPEPRTKPEVLGIPLDGVGKEFRAEPYLRATAALQAKGKDAACVELMTVARRSGRDPRANQAIIILCRMLFTAKQGVPLRGPRLGRPVMVGQNLPLRGVDGDSGPITLVDGVPFCLTYGYDLDGRAELADAYLAYCIMHGDWATAPYTPASNAKMREALKQLLNSPRWERPLEATERDFLEGQIRPSQESGVAARQASQVVA